MSRQAVGTFARHVLVECLLGMRMRCLVLPCEPACTSSRLGAWHEASTRLFALCCQGSWILSDLESVSRAPVEAAGEGSFRAACWTPDTLDECGVYTTASDVQLVGRLMETCSILVLGAECGELKAQLTASVAASRPSAEQALCHPWFSASVAP